MELEFKEEQKFYKWWQYLIAGFPLIFISSMFFTHIDEINFKINLALSFIIIWPFFFCIIIFIWFVFLKLKTIINKEGIFVHFQGIPFCKKKIAWVEIETISVVEYSPLTDYGGWGVRNGFTGKGWCYNVSGKAGIKLIKTNGKPFLIGTQQKEGVEKIINLYFKR